MDLHDSIYFTFNKFFYDLIKGVKDLSPDLKKKIKENYKVKSNNTTVNMDRFVDVFTPELYQKLISLDVSSILADEEFGSIEIVKAVRNAVVLENTPSEYHSTFVSFVYIFALLSEIKKQEDKESASDLFAAVMSALRNMQKGEEYDSCLADVYDDDIKILVSNTSKVIKNSTLEEKQPDLTPEFLAGTKIGSLAQEITKEINLDDLKIEKPEDLLNMGNNGMISSIMSKVGSKINEKLERGELNHEDLLKEAFSMLGAMQKGQGGNPFNSPMMQNLMKNAGNIKIDESKLKNMSAKDRLKKKHEEKYGK